MITKGLDTHRRSQEIVKMGTSDDFRYVIYTNATLADNVL